MPIQFQQVWHSTGQLGVWDIQEAESFFTQRMELQPEELEVLSVMKGKRPLEWLAVRYLLHTLLDTKERWLVLKDAFGKPYLPLSENKISMSHSHDLVAVCVAPENCGIDIQFQVDKIARIAPRFISDMEFHFIDEQHATAYYHVFWGAKEAIFKAYGRKSVDFRTQMTLAPFQYNVHGGQTIGLFVNETHYIEYQIDYQFHDGYYLVTALELRRD